MITANIKKKIFVFSFRLTIEGLRIEYAYKGMHHHLTATPEQAADLLKNIGLIEDYAGAGDEVCVEVLFDGDPIPAQLYWTDFLAAFHFSQSDAIDCATQVEIDKSIHPLIQNICDAHF